MAEERLALQTSALRVVWELAQARDIRVYLVGGVVRDRILARQGADIDMVVSRGTIPLARQVADCLGEAFFILDEANQVARVLLKDDEEGHLVLDFALLRGESIEEDLSLRDFTIDAMAFPLEAGVPCRGALIDPLHGLVDLEGKTVRAVSPEVFHQDSVRLLRAVRLGVELGFGIDPDTETLIRRDAGLLATVSGERIRDELARMLLLPRSVDALKDLWRLGLLGDLFPISAPGVCRALARLGHFEEVLAGEDILPSPIAHPVRAWAGETMPGGRTRWVALRLAALLYGSGGEEWEGAKSVLSRLHFSRRENALMRMVVEAQPLYAKVASGGEVRPLMAYRFFRDAKGVGIGLILVGLADSLGRGTGQSHEAPLQLLRYRFEEYSSVISPPQLVDGEDMLEELGLRPGPQVGRALEAVREAQVAGQVRDRQEALALARRFTGAARAL